MKQPQTKVKAAQVGEWGNNKSKLHSPLFLLNTAKEYFETGITYVTVAQP